MRQKFFAHLKTATALIAGTLFVACMELPDYPDISNKVQGVSVSVAQYGKKDSTILKINPRDTAYMVATVHPSPAKDLDYFWYKGEELLGEGMEFGIEFMLDIYIPDRLVLKDREGNSLEKEFKVVINTPPRLDATTIPAAGDTLYGNEHTSFLFQWKAYNQDANDTLQNLLEIDDVRYSVGQLNHIKQSGFQKGKHQFRVIVQDIYGDSDSTSWKDFYVENPSEDK